MGIYKNLDVYLGTPAEGKGIFSRALMEDLLREIQDEPPLPLEERFMYDITCNQEVFDALGFPVRALMQFSQETRLLPREILGINSSLIVLTHDPCMRKLAWHIENKLDKRKRHHARETMKKCAKLRQAIGDILSQGNIGDTRLRNILQPAIHHRICTVLELPTN